MKAVIIAAGRGKRMMPLTGEIPKPLVPIRGTPLLEYSLRGLRWAGILHVLVVIRYLGERIQEAYGDGSALGMKLDYAWQTGPDGTGSALLAAEELLGDEPFMLLWGDILMDPENYVRIQKAHMSYSCDLLSTLNWVEDTSNGAAVYARGDRITGIEEKPAPGSARTHWNQAGLFVCTKDIFAAVRKSGVSTRGELEFTSGVQTMIKGGRDVRWMRLGGFWSDVGTPEALDRLQEEPAVAALLR